MQLVLYKVRESEFVSYFRIFKALFHYIEFSVF